MPSDSTQTIFSIDEDGDMIVNSISVCDSIYEVRIDTSPAIFDVIWSISQIEDSSEYVDFYIGNREYEIRERADSTTVIRVYGIELWGL